MSSKASPAKASPAAAAKERSKSPEKASSPAKASPVKASPEKKSTAKSPAKSPAKAAAAEAPIESKAGLGGKAKEMAMPDAISCCLVDHANARTLQAVFESVQASGDDAMCEKVVHTIAVHCRMHAAALKQALLPLVQKLGQGADLGKALEEKLAEGERVLGALEGEKKHLGNEAFIAAWQAQKKADTELMEMAERDLLPAMMEELDASDLVAAASLMETAKLEAPLA